MRHVCFLSFCLLCLNAPAMADTYDQERAMYERSPTRCVEKTKQSAAEHGLRRYHDWKQAVDSGITPPEGAFGEAGQAFEYLYKQVGCRDALMVYRYGNLLRHNKDYDTAIELMQSSLDGVREHYPSLEATVEGALGRACVAAGLRHDAIEHYRRVLMLDPDDAGVHLNLANQLYHDGQLQLARRYTERAIALPLSDYGRSVADDLLAKTGSD